MSERNTIFRCQLCGNIVDLVAPGGGTLVCCGQPMTVMVENTTEAAVEKHLPVIEKIPGGYSVVVGSVEHPMAAAHWIQWIELVAGDTVQRRFLAAGEPPRATFLTDETEVSARAYCNLHGFWKA